MHAYVVSDFSVLNVAMNSHSAKPMLYKIAGTWGNHEGSMLLWVLILVIFGGAVAAFGGNLPPGLRARALAVQAWIAIGFYLFILFTSNPFARLDPPPLDGRGLNPLLQDPGLAFHPPLLYLGYVGFSMAFSFAVAALIEGRVDASWARWVRPWTLAAWTFLTCGIALGSWWAYYELGWGGWWYWDPVENASLLPWLTGTALLHSAVVVEKRDALKGWTVFLAIVTFSLSLLGTFLVRSGVLTSVHAFATDPARGIFILALLIIVIGGSFALFAWRGPQLPMGGLFQPMSREGGLLLNNLLLCAAAASVLLGTLYPLLLEAVDGAKVSVGPPFFNAVFIPLMAPLVVAMAVGPLLPWKRGDLGAALGRLWAAALAAAAAVAMAWAIYDARSVLGLLGLGLAAWLFFGTLAEFAQRIGLLTVSPAQSLRRAGGLPRATWGMTLAHAGLGRRHCRHDRRFGAGRKSTSRSCAWATPSASAATPSPSSAPSGCRGRTTTPCAATSPSAPMASRWRSWRPERRDYPVEGQQTTEAAIRPTLAGDLYAVIGEPQGNGGYVTRLYFTPLVGWIWGGVGLMVLGGLISLSDRRHRVGAPAARRAPRHGRRGRGRRLPELANDRHRRPPAPGLSAAAGAVPGARRLLLGRARQGSARHPVGADRPEGAAVRAGAARRVASAGFSSNDLLGQVSLVNVFGSWCVACRIEHPFLAQLKGRAWCRSTASTGAKRTRRPDPPGSPAGAIPTPWSATIRTAAPPSPSASPARRRPSSSMPRASSATSRWGRSPARSGTRPMADRSPLAGRLMPRCGRCSRWGWPCCGSCRRPRRSARRSQPDEVLADPALEARAREIGRELRCLVCQNQSIDDSDAELARDLRVLVRQRLSAGRDQPAGDRLHRLALRRLRPAAPAGQAGHLCPVVRAAGVRRHRRSLPSCCSTGDGTAGRGAALPLSAAEEHRLASLLGNEPTPGDPRR